ncbi:pentatricopeptide repeat-containing protein At1g62260, mitochondrial [Silene latifolia]|uniref:pentatricopeptide repeat-containing protein At1g62260, mitochondrial n=1 Tax=Silene latifolia TaxID=37657 RepID=UPI003D76DC08
MTKMMSCSALLERTLYCPFIFSTFLKRTICHIAANDGKRLDPTTWNKRVFVEIPQRNAMNWNSKLSGYVKNKEISKARKLFDEMPERAKDVVSWNLMIKGYVSCHGGGMKYVDEGKALFDRMPERDLVSWNTMISGYARARRMDDALRLFNCMSKKDVITWNAMVTGFLQNGNANRAIEWFKKIPKRDASSLSALISGLIRINKWDKATSMLLDCKEGGYVEKGALVQAYNTLIAGYGQKGRVDEARKLFDQIPYCRHERVGEKVGFKRNLISWNAMIMAYVKVGDFIAARELFDQMVQRDTFSWNTMISGYVKASNMEQAEKLFSQMPDPDTVSWNMMVSGYSQVGNLKSALDFFIRNPEKNIFSWNSVIAGCDTNGDYGGAVKLFIQMRTEQVKPDKHTLSSILSVSTGLATLDLGRQIHQLVTKTLFADTPINNSLVTMYSRCGAIAEARGVFDEMGMKKDVISWNAMIGGYASHGYATLALELFEVMKDARVQPTFITFISVLNACSQAGLLNEARKYFSSMVSEFGIKPRTEHYAALVDIVGRHGHLEEAMDLINNMPQKPDKAIWGALLGACRMHNHVKLARIASDVLSTLEPESSASYVLLHNTFADVEQWEDAKDVRNMMEIKNIRKGRASSW